MLAADRANGRLEADVFLARATRWRRGRSDSKPHCRSLLHAASDANGRAARWTVGQLKILAPIPVLPAERVQRMSIVHRPTCASDLLHRPQYGQSVTLIYPVQHEPHSAAPPARLRSGNHFSHGGHGGSATAPPTPPSTTKS